MKKLTIFFVALCISIMSAMFLFGCGSTAASYSVIVPDGAPVAALADMWGENIGNAEINYSITAESNLNAEFTKGTDFIVAPINTGANFHKAAMSDDTKFDYKLMNVTSWGVLYVITTESAYMNADDSLNVQAFLKQFDNKEIVTIGLPAIPGKSMNYLLQNADVESRLIAGDAPTIQQRIVKNEQITAVLGEPAITALKKQGANFRVLCSISEVYTEITGNEFPMSGMFVRSSIVQNDKAAIKAINARISESVEKFNADPEVAGRKAAEAGSTINGAVLKDAAPKMNMRFKNSADSKAAVVALLKNIGVEADDSLFF